MFISLDAAVFGDSTISGGHRAWGSNAIRGVSFGIETASPGAKLNLIEYATIAPLGNALDFGDLTIARGHGDACSNAHGGLG